MPSNEGLGGLSSRTAANPFKVLVIGGSYGGLGATLNLLDLCNGRQPRFAGDPPPLSGPGKIPVDITVVDEKDGYFHLISSPLALASEEYAPKAWTQFDRIPALKGVRFVRGSVKSVDPEAKQAVISEADTQAEVVQDYDFLVAATGLRRVWPVVPQAQTRESYLEEVRAHIDAIKASDGVVVVGGGQFYIPLFNSSLTKTGAVGIEMAAEIKLVMPEQKVTLIHSRDKLCSAEPLPDDFKDRCLIALHEAGVETVMGQRVVESTTGRMGDKVVSTLKLADGTTLQAGQVIYAVSKSVPSTSYLPASVLDEEGYVKITSSLTFGSDHFAVGDIVQWSGIKRCGAAMHHGQYAAQNIHRSMLRRLVGTASKPMELAEVPPMIGIAIGRQLVAYYPPDGTTYGEDLLKQSFGDDLSNTICWNYMQLGKEFP